MEEPDARTLELLTKNFSDADEDKLSESQITVSGPCVGLSVP
jgi:hypothetical protein